MTPSHPTHMSSPRHSEPPGRSTQLRIVRSVHGNGHLFQPSRVLQTFAPGSCVILIPSSRPARPPPRSIARDHDTNPSRPPRNRTIRPSPLSETSTSPSTVDPSPACPSRASCKTCRSARAAPRDGPPPAARRPSRPSTTAHPAPRTSRAPCPTPAPPPRA